MKIKKQLILMLLLVFVLKASSQNLYNIVIEGGAKKTKLFSLSTTEDEYNYMVKGYRNGLESGSDIKKGYSVNTTFEKITFGDYDFKFIPFYRSDNSFVGLIVKAHSGVSGKDYWYGLPFKNEVLYKRFSEDAAILDEVMTNAFVNAFVSFTRENIEPNTSQTEYNYMTSGYKNHLSDGSDLKKGYFVGVEKTIKIVGSLANYEFTFIPFNRDDKSCAGTIIKLYSDGSVSGGTYYYGVSNSNGEILTQFNKEKGKQGTRVLHAFLLAYVKYALEN